MPGLTRIGLFLVIYVTIGQVFADETFLDDRLSNNSGNKFTDVDENRKHKPYHDLFFSERKPGCCSSVYLKPLHAIKFMGGLQSLVAFVLIKIKIVLVTITIIGVIAFALKLFGVLKYGSLFYKNDYPNIISAPYEFSSYPGPPTIPYTSPHQEHGSYGNEWPSHPGEYSRSSNVLPKSVDLAEIMHSFMHVDKNECRARLICEIENSLRSTPFFQSLMRLRNTKTKPETTKNFEDCAPYYRKCLLSTQRSARRTKRRVLIRR